jgi:urease accessory protein
VNGVLELSLARRGGATRIERQYQRAPLHVYRPIYLDENLPEMAFVFVQQFGDGFVDGDHCRVEVDCGPETSVHITTQAATNLYRAEHGVAGQILNLGVGSGGVLEYLPDAVVPFRGSRFAQQTTLTVDPTATAIIGELLLPGRVARGELHAYELYRTETEARRPDGTVLFADVLRLSPAEGKGVRSLALLGGRHVLATLYVVTEGKRPAELVEMLRGSLLHDDVLAGVSELPNGCGACVRLLGRTSTAVRAAVTDSWQAARLALLGVPAPDLRKR